VDRALDGHPGKQPVSEGLLECPGSGREHFMSNTDGQYTALWGGRPASVHFAILRFLLLELNLA
jgi:hypothetical protein